MKLHFGVRVPIRCSAIVSRRGISQVAAKRLVIPANEPESRGQVLGTPGCRIESGMTSEVTSIYRLLISIGPPSGPGLRGEDASVSLLISLAVFLATGIARMKAQLRFQVSVFRCQASLRLG